MGNGRRFRRGLTTLTSLNGRAPQALADPRIVCGARCSWWDSIDKAGRAPSGLPVTPCCGSPMFEVESEDEWWRVVDAHQTQTGDDSYRQFVEWIRGRCFPDLATARQAFDEEHPPGGESCAP